MIDTHVSQETILENYLSSSYSIIISGPSNVLSTADMVRKMLRLLLDSEGIIPTHEISQKLDMPISTGQRRGKRLEEEYLINHYSLDRIKFGYRRIDLLIYTEGGETMNVGKELLKREEVTYAARTIGDHTIDVRIEVFVKDNGVLLDDP